MYGKYKTFIGVIILAGWAQYPFLLAQQQESIPAPAEQPEPQRLLQGGLLGRGRMGNQALGMVPLLQVDSVRRELHVEGEQATRLESFTLQIREDFAEEIRQLLQSLREANPEERRQFREKVGEIAQRINQRLDSVLNQEQTQRLKQIDLQLGLRRNGPAAALTSKDLAAALDLTPEQKKQLRQKARENPQRESLTLAEARAEVSEILTPDQQDKLENLLGPEFDLPAALLEKQSARGGRLLNQGRERRSLRRGLEPKEDAPEPPDT